MIIRETESFRKELIKLPTSIRKKYIKQLQFLIQDFYYPSLHTKKLQGEKDIWEARIDYQYRFIFIKTAEVLTLITIGPHDDGLGKK